MHLQRDGLLPQNDHVPGLINYAETGVLEFGHHKAALILSDKPGVRFQYDRVRVPQDVHLMANQIILQAFDITYQVEAGETMIAHDLS
jgi:hypothetical protein